ncbi:MAG: hypothetical protein HEQ32_00255 [Vampirovibrio sp.]
MSLPNHASPWSPQHPAFQKILMSPEFLGGIGGIVLVVFLAFNVLFSSVLATADQLDKDIKTKQEEITKQETLDALAKELEAESKLNTNHFLLLREGEIASVKIFDFLKSLGTLSTDSLALPSIHKSVDIFHVQQVLATVDPKAPAAPTTTAPASASNVQNIFSPDLIPFSSEQVQQLNLNVSAEQYTYTMDVRGSYLGLVNFVRKLAEHAPFVAIKGLEFKIDPNAPSVLLFRGSAVSNSGPSALEAGKPVAITPTATSTSVSGTPLVLTLTLDIFLKIDKLGGTAATTVAPTVEVAATPPA